MSIARLNFYFLTEEFNDAESVQELCQDVATVI